MAITAKRNYFSIPHRSIMLKFVGIFFFRKSNSTAFGSTCHITLFRQVFNRAPHQMTNKWPCKMWLNTATIHTTTRLPSAKQGTLFWSEIIFCHPIINTVLQLSFQQNLFYTEPKGHFQSISTRLSSSRWHICPLFLFLFLSLDPFDAGTIFIFSVFFTPETL